MTIVNLIVALALMGGLWVAIVKGLAASIRRTERIEAAALRTGQAPPPVYSGAADSRIVDKFSAMKDLPA